VSILANSKKATIFILGVFADCAAVSRALGATVLFG
jgi:hypothetical protein